MFAKIAKLRWPVFGLSWPPKMTTICPLGPSAVSPITSLMNDFREEVESLIPTKVLL